MAEKRQTGREGTLAGEIQRKTAEIDDWPVWARPYEHVASKASQMPSPAHHGRNAASEGLGKSELDDC